MKQIKINTDLNQRLDHYLVEELGLNRSFITKLIKEDKVLVNGKSVKPGFNLKNGDLIDVLEAEVKELDLKPENLNLDIVYEDKNLLVVNKPKGLVVHPAKSHKD